MRRSLIALAALAAVVLCSWGFRPESAAIGWHLRHGMHVDGAGVRVRVPLLFEAIASADSITLSTTPGKARTRLFHSPSALIILSDKKPVAGSDAPLPNADMLARTREQHEHLGSKLTAQRDIRLGNDKLTCLQFEGGEFILGVDVWCAPEKGGPLVSFGGSPQLVNEFYNLLQSAERIGR